MRMYQVDAFTDRLFGGNPAAILILDDWLPDALMQSIAQENNLAETAFAVRRDDHWALRWFTPTEEVAFCGHATLATAHILVTEYGAIEVMKFDTQVGCLTVSPKDGGYCLDIPSFSPEPLAEVPVELGGVFEEAPVGLFRNFENIFAVLVDQAQVTSFKPDLLRLARLGPMGLVITARGEDTDFVSRYFAPGAGIPEDPVTGSTHATLVPYWAKVLGKSELTAFQASARGGQLRCVLAADRVELFGQARTFMSANLRLDPILQSAEGLMKGDRP